jgi:hypothetical protein
MAVPGLIMSGHPCHFRGTGGHSEGRGFPPCRLAVVGSGYDCGTDQRPCARPLSQDAG